MHGAKDEGSFEAHAPYLKDALNRITKVIQLAEAKLGSEDLSTGKENAEAGVTQEWGDESELPRERTKNRRWRRPYEVLGRGHTWRSRSRVRVTGELDCFSAHIRLREPGKSEDKAEESIDRKGVEEVENAEANSKYLDKVKGQRPRNFIRSPSNLVFSTLKRMGEAEYPSSLTYPAEELCISSVTLQRKLMEDNSYQILTIGGQYY
ncbi:hypothetical protein GW17_00031675 [Ensete ventricosum]|nr:hypothetical protein GW17_00031675 [Ensete ventricosum]